MRIEIVERLVEDQLVAVKELQSLVFKGVDDKEGMEDFYHPVSAHVLAYVDDVLVGWAGVHVSQVEFEGRQLMLGGYGIGVHPNYRRQGIAGKMATKAMEYLNDAQVDVGFLSVDPKDVVSQRLHEKQGFVILPRDFSWTNAKGEVKLSGGGMIAPIKSDELFESVLNGKESLYVGRGYW